MSQNVRDFTGAVLALSRISLMPGRYAECRYAECRYAERHSAECHGAPFSSYATYLTIP